VTVITFEECFTRRGTELAHLLGLCTAVVGISLIFALPSWRQYKLDLGSFSFFGEWEIKNSIDINCLDIN